MRSSIVLAGLLLLCASSVARAGEIETRAQIAYEATKLYNAEDFAALDRLFDEARTKSTRTPGGMWQLWVLHHGVLDAGGVPHDDAQWQAQLQRAQRWVAQRPGSVTAPLVVAETELAHARAVGCGECTVVDESKRGILYRIALEHARTVFTNVKDKSAVDPQWYADMLEIGWSQRWAPATVDAMLTEAGKRVPDYYTTWFNAAQYALDRDDDQGPAEIEALARRAMADNPGKDGALLYARIWWHADEKRFGPHLFTQTPVVWKDFDAGMRELLARYPDDWNRNRYAQFACYAKHPERARELMRGHQPIAGAWDSFEAYAACVQPKPEAPSIKT
jgi:hypothetical protein